MRPKTRQALEQLFHEDHEYATKVANQMANEMANPPDFVREVTGPRRGWKHPAGEGYCH